MTVKLISGDLDGGTILEAGSGARYRVGHFAVIGWKAMAAGYRMVNVTLVDGQGPTLAKGMRLRGVDKGQPQDRSRPLAMEDPIVFDLWGNAILERQPSGRALLSKHRPELNELGVRQLIANSMVDKTKIFTGEDRAVVQRRTASGRIG